MYFNFKKQNNILNVDNFFVSLDHINEANDYFLSFEYKILQSLAFKHNALTVEVSVYSKLLTREKVLTNVIQQGFVDTKKMINKSLTQMSTAKSTRKEQNDYLLAQRRSDITSYVNNSIVKKLSTGVSPENIQELNTKKLVLVSIESLQQKNDDKPVLTYATPSSYYESIDTATSSSIDINSKLNRLNMISKGIDPSYIVNMSHKSVTAHDAIQGTLRKQKTIDHENSPQSQLLNSVLFSSENFRKENSTNILQHGQVAHVLTDVIQDQITVNVPLTITQKSRKTSNGKEITTVYVEYRLINSKTGEVIDRIVKDVDLAKQLQFYITPKNPPIVLASNSSISSRANLEIKQTSKNATSIALYKKMINKSVTDVEQYTLIDTYRLSSDDKPLLLSVDKPVNSIAIYRVISLSETGIMGSDYTNVIITPNKIQQKNSISSILLPLENGIKIELNEIPDNVISIQPLVRNFSILEKEYRNVGSPILIEDSMREINHITFVDQNVVNDHAYEYAFRLYFKSGVTEIVGHKMIDYQSVQPGKIDVKLQNVVISQSDSLDVQFVINFNLEETTVSLLKTLMDKEDITKYFSEDVKKEREFLKNLIAHNIQRVDLNTGERVDFGVIIKTEFSDKAISEKNSITPLKNGHKYRYELYTLIRSPETMFETLQKSKIDPITKKPYSFKPSKFLHPIVLKDGTLVSSQGLKTKYGKDQMMYGSIGLTAHLDVSFDKSMINIVDFQATQINNNVNLLTWKIEGQLSFIDHLLLLKEVNGVRTIIGKTHSEFQYGNCQYYHKLTNRDIGEIRYVIIPIFNTYDHGASVKSNAVKVEL